MSRKNLMKNNIAIIFVGTFFTLQSTIKVEHAFPSQYVTQALAQWLTHEELQQLRDNEPLELKKSSIQTNDPDTTVEASFIINREGDKITITSDIKDTFKKQFESADELTRAQKWFVNFKAQSSYPDADTYSRCNHNELDSTLKEEDRLFNRTVQTSCTTEISIAEFMELTKPYKTARN